MYTLYLLVKCCKLLYLFQKITSVSTVTIRSSGQEEFIDEMMMITDLVVVITGWLFIMTCLLNIDFLLK